MPNRRATLTLLPAQNGPKSREELLVLETRWRRLEVAGQKEAKTGSFFTSWAWIGTLLRQTRADTWLFALEEGNEDLALGIIGHAPRKSIFGPIPLLHLNLTGLADEDSVYPEFNHLMFRDGREEDAIEGLFEVLNDPENSLPNWSALRLSGITGATASNIEQISGLKQADVKTSNAPFIPLKNMRDTDDFLLTLSNNTRSQIRRSMRLFEKETGPLSVERLTALDAIKAGLSDLADLQREKLATMDTPSAFETPFFGTFLESLLVNHQVPEDLNQGHSVGAEILKIKAGSERLGYLINFHHQGTVSNYQCAFEPFSDNRLKPGLISHALAVARYAILGNDVYHLLAGDQQYKKSLANQSDTLCWLEVQRPVLALKAENAARSLKQRLTK